jgi:(S)-2-hydroxyglutarate dehydrogenase
MLIEKESSSGQHASGSNSGVLHTGVYYKKGTLKALLLTSSSPLAEYVVSMRKLE